MMWSEFPEIEEKLGNGTEELPNIVEKLWKVGLFPTSNVIIQSSVLIFDFLHYGMSEGLTTVKKS